MESIEDIEEFPVTLRHHWYGHVEDNYELDGSPISFKGVFTLLVLMFIVFPLLLAGPSVWASLAIGYFVWQNRRKIFLGQ